MEETTDTLANMSSPEERNEYLARNHPTLSNDVVYWLRDRESLTRDKEVASVEFRYGSLDNVSAESGEGNVRNGHFRNELIAIVKTTDGERLPVIVVCMNGLFAEPDQMMALESLANHTPLEEFAISRGEGLTHHVGYLTAIDIAERHQLPIYQGRSMTPRNLITYDQARAMENRTDYLQVTVYVEPGDYFDLRNRRYIPGRRRG